MSKVDSFPKTQASVKNTGITNRKRRYKAPPLPGIILLELEEEALNPSLDIDVDKTPLGTIFDRYMMITYIYLADGPTFEKNRLRSQIMDLSLELERESIAYLKNKRPKRLLKRMDICHEQLRCLWRRYYLLGYFGNRYNKAINKKSINALKKWIHISVYIDALGRKLDRYYKSQSDVSRQNKYVVNS